MHSQIPTEPLLSTTYAQRVAFVSEIAGRLHTYGTTAQRLETAVTALAKQLGLDCEPWSNPTGIILSFSDPRRAIGSSDITRVIRLEPGENDLHKLCVADYVAENVSSGRMSIAQGHTALRRLDRPLRFYEEVHTILASGLAVAGIAGLWKLSWLDIITASVIGLLIGVLSRYINRYSAAKEASEALTALIAATVACCVGTYIGPLNLNSVIIASLVVLLPGMSLTNAVNELTSQHWVSGTARFAGALMVVIKMAVGSYIAVTVAHKLGMHPQSHSLATTPEWVEGGALCMSAYAFAVLFKAHRYDYPLVMASAIFGYLISRFTGQLWGSIAGTFISAMVITLSGNLYGRLVQRPGALIRLPGIILLVPGSMSLRGLLEWVQLNNADVSNDAFGIVLSVVMALVSGLLFGNLLVPARKPL